MIEQIEATTFRVPVGDEWVELGNRDAAKFEPHVMLPRWGGESWVKLFFPSTKLVVPTVSLDGKRLQWRDEDSGIGIDYHTTEPRIVYTPDENGKPQPFLQNELGGFETDIILYKKPKTNQIILEIESNGLEFQPQGSLHPDHPTWVQDSLGGYAHRPLNVVGSYSVYGSKTGDIIGGKQYGCGKVGHFYRPELMDAIGKRCWADLLIENGKYIVTIPWDFLNSAVYPIQRVAGAEFGYTTTGGSDVTGHDGFTIASNINHTGAAGTATSMSFYCRNSGNKAKYALYLVSDDSLVEATNEGTAGAGVAWVEGTFPVGPVVSAVDYTLRWRVEDAGTNCYFDSSDALDMRLNALAWAAAWPDPQANDLNDNHRKWSIKVTYTPAAAGWTGKLSGVTNPAKIDGVAVANISKVMGVS